jgi:hypothetical protein
MGGDVQAGFTDRIVYLFEPIQQQYKRNFNQVLATF